METDTVSIDPLAVWEAIRIYCVIQGQRKGWSAIAVVLASRDLHRQCSRWAQGGFGSIPELGECQKGFLDVALPHLEWAGAAESSDIWEAARLF